MKTPLAMTTPRIASLKELLEGQHSLPIAHTRQTGLQRTLTALLIAGGVLLSAVLWPASVQSAAAPDLELQASYDLATALDMFGAQKESNYCPILFGGTLVRPDRAVILRVRHAEKERSRDLEVRSILDGAKAQQLYAWVDIPRWALFLTDRYAKLAPVEQLALLFHEVRGHWELRLSDKQMLAALYPGMQDDENTHLISIAISNGCPSLRGRTTDEVYRMVLEAGPFLDQQ
jgi:hypothetical protein